jgi:hypothetical protein
MWRQTATINARRRQLLLAIFHPRHPACCVPQIDRLAAQELSSDVQQPFADCFRAGVDPSPGCCKLAGQRVIRSGDGGRGVTRV